MERALVVLVDRIESQVDVPGGPGGPDCLVVEREDSGPGRRAETTGLRCPRELWRPGTRDGQREAAAVQRPAAAHLGPLARDRVVAVDGAAEDIREVQAPMPDVGH